MTGFTPVVRQTINVVRDAHGEEILRTTASEWTLLSPEGVLTNGRLHEAIQLSDGSAWSPAMAFGQNPVLVGCCDLCRHPPFRFPRRERATHGLVRLDRAKTCPCGTLLCPRHACRCADRRYRCPACYRRWRLRRGLLGVFFTGG
jgi:hypothetical protein